jgi:hypothetical protein
MDTGLQYADSAFNDYLYSKSMSNLSSSFLADESTTFGALAAVDCDGAGGSCPSVPGVSKLVSFDRSGRPCPSGPGTLKLVSFDRSGRSCRFWVFRSDPSDWV